VVSPIVTRGFTKTRSGVPGNRIIAQGYGGVVKKIIRAVIRGGSKGLKTLERLPEILYVICARLMRVNDQEILEDVSGAVKRLVDPNIDDPKLSARIDDSKIINRQKDILITASKVSSVKKDGD